MVMHANKGPDLFSVEVTRKKNNACSLVEKYVASGFQE